MKKIIFNTTWLLFEKILRIIINLFIWGKIANAIGIVDFGRLSYCQALVYLIIPISSLGIDQIIRNKLAILKNPENTDILSAGLHIKLLCSLFICSLIIILNKYFRENNGVIVLYLYLGIFFRSFGLMEYYFDNRLESWKSVCIRFSAFIAINMLYLYAVMENASIETYAIITSIEFFIIALVYIILGWNDFIKFHFYLDGHLIIDILKSSFPIFVCDIAASIFLRVNQVVLESISSPESLAVYSIALRFTEVWYFVPASVIISMYPSISKSYSNSQKVYNNSVLLLFELMIIISLLIIVFNIFIAPKLLLYFYGAKYSKSIKILEILSFSNLFIFLGMAQELIDVSLNMIFWRLIRLVTGVIIVVFSCHFLTKGYGVDGAAWSLVIGFSWTYFLCNIFNPKSRPIIFMQIRSILLSKTAFSLKSWWKEI